MEVMRPDAVVRDSPATKNVVPRGAVPNCDVAAADVRVSCNSTPPMSVGRR
jgi:hypothetical protein